MYIDPFVAGVVTTLFVEFVLFFLWAAVRISRRK